VTRPDQQQPARDLLRERLLEAARREEAQTARPARRRRRRRRRTIGLGVAALLGAAVAAGAADLISTGEPVRDASHSGSQYEPAPAGAPVLVAKARDPDRNSTWGVGIYTGANGQTCAIAGQVRGVTLGRIENGRFRAYTSDSNGACGDLRRHPIFLDRLLVGGAHPRTIIYGRARASERTVVAESEGRPHSAPTARGGAFVFVFAGHHSLAELRPRVGSSAQPG
jgi:hypothetical protein